MKTENILLIILISIIIIVVIMIAEKNINDKNDKNNLMGKLNNSPSSSLIEGFENTEENLDEMRKYMKIHGLYPMDKGNDMSKYVLKSSVEKASKCPDMSKYIPKSAIPRQVKCPQINRDEWVRKSELPPNWNKNCPAHPDLTNYVLKSTIPPTQNCPSCICPKIKVNAGLCREPTKEDCIKSGALKDACPKPEPCPVPKCPEPKPCPVPKDPVCPKCPEAPKQGSCPEPERCPPAKNCPKCYSVKYVKVPVVKSEPPLKPQKETIFPQNLIETKLLRQHAPRQPRQPKVMRLEASDEAREALKEELRKELLREMANAPTPSRNNEVGDNDLEALKEELKQELLQEMANAPKPSSNNKNVNELLNDMLENENVNSAPIMTEENMFPSFTNEAVDNNNSNFLNEIKNVITNNNQNNNSNNSGKCNNMNLNKLYKKYGTLGFNDNL